MSFREALAHLTRLETELDAAIDAGIDAPQALVDELQAAVLQTDGRGDALGAYIIELNNRAALLRDEAKASTARALRFERRSDRLMEYIKFTLQQAGRTSIEFDRHTFSLVNGRERVIVDDESKLPESCTRLIPESREPDKVEIAKRIKAGDMIEGAHIDRGPVTVRVYR